MPMPSSPNPTKKTEHPSNAQNYQTLGESWLGHTLIMVLFFGQVCPAYLLLVEGRTHLKTWWNHHGEAGGDVITLYALRRSLLFTRVAKRKHPSTRGPLSSADFASRHLALRLGTVERT